MPDGSNETVTVSITGGTLEVLKDSVEGEPEAVEPVTLDDARLYLRVDGEDDDAVIAACLGKAQSLCQSVSRLDDEEFLAAENEAAVRAAVLYALGYLYQNREGANHEELTRTLRALLMDVRREVF